MFDGSTTLRFHRPQLPPPAGHFSHTLSGVGGRCDLRFRAKVQVMPLDGQLPAIRASSEDLCQRGMFISTATQYPLGTVLQLGLSTDYGDLTLTGRVVHRLDGIGVGCEFIDLEERQRVALNFLATLRR